MRVTRFLVPLLILLAIPLSHAEKNELMPMFGFRFGGQVERLETSQDFSVGSDLSYGLVYSRVLSPQTEFEFIWSRQSTAIDAPQAVGESSLDLDVDYYHAGATYHPSTKSVRPYVAASAGLTRADPSPSGFDSELFLSLGVGGGVRVYLNDRIGLRFDGRAYFTFTSGSEDFSKRPLLFFSWTVPPAHLIGRPLGGFVRMTSIAAKASQ